jgi:beta-mannosidase
MRIVVLLLFMFSNLLRANDTLGLRHWKFLNDTSIQFDGGANLNALVRMQNAISRPELNARFSPEGQAFHDSVASLKHVIVSEFELNRNQRKSPVVELQLDYLQTFTDVYVNNHFIGKTDNAFRLWKFQLPRKLLKRRNVLRIEFHPPRETASPLAKRHIKLPADNQHDSIKTAPFIRQPQQEFGWDFCYPEIFTGFRVVPRLVFRKSQYIESLRVETESIAYGNARLSVHIRGSAKKRKNILHLSVDTNQAIQVVLPRGDFDTIVEYRIPKARLWWPNGTHEGPQLYTLNAVFQSNKPDTISFRFGVRTVDLIQEKDSIGTSFYFKINKEAIFMQGANVVMPNEVFEGDRSRGLSTKELNYITSTGMNMLRIWGGGTYFPDAFYDWADENGILIWQDFMFACTYYPVDDKMLDIMRPEITYQTERLSGHASLALFCGNNEIDVARKNWGWEKTHGYSIPKKRMLDSQYEFLFERFIPEIIANSKSNVPYLSSSPVSNWGDINDFNSGDNHDWGVWHGEMPLEESYARIPRFMSEYGFPSFPSIAVLEKYLGRPKADIQPSELVLSYKGIGLLQQYLMTENLRYQSLNDIIQSSQYLQAKHYKRMNQVLRNSKGKCMGTLFWQLNDVSPVMSWSVLDMDGNLKYQQDN